MPLIKSRGPALNDVDYQPCPACGHDSAYIHQLDRFVHIDLNKSDADCWVAISRGGDPAANLQKIQEDALDLAMWPLPLIAAALNIGVYELENRHRDEIVKNSVGLWCLPGAVVKRLTDERDARLEAEREKRRQDRLNPTPHPVRERIRARRAHQDATRFADGADMTLAQKATAVVMERDYADRLNATRERIDESLSGALVYHPVPRKQ